VLVPLRNVSVITRYGIGEAHLIGQEPTPHQGHSSQRVTLFFGFLAVVPEVKFEDKRSQCGGKYDAMIKFVSMKFVITI